MQSLIGIRFLILIGIITACSSSSTEKNNEIEDATASRFPIVKLQVSINDYEDWYTVYSKHQEVQSESGIQTLGLYRDVEFRNKYHLFLSADDLSSLKNYLMTEAFESNFYNPAHQIEDKAFIDVIELSDEEFSHDYRLLISHKVKDYLEWKPYFDADTAERRTHDLTLIGIGRDIEDPTTIYVMFAYDDENKVEEFINNDALKDRMKRAGVIGELKLSRLSPIQVSSP